MRARASIEPLPGKGDREMIVVTEIPYQVNKAELLKKIADLVRDKRLEGISDIRDESDRDGLRVVIELKRDAHGEIVLNKLYQMTALQSTFGYNCLAIVGQRPEVLDLRSALLRFIEHRREVVIRRTRFDLRQARAQRELIEGLGMAVTDVDLVVNTIRSSKDPEEAAWSTDEAAAHGPRRVRATRRAAGRRDQSRQSARRILPFGASGESDPRDAALPTHRSRAREARHGVRKSLRSDRRARGDSSPAKSSSTR